MAANVGASELLDDWPSESRGACTAVGSTCGLWPVQCFMLAHLEQVDVLQVANALHACHQSDSPADMPGDRMQAGKH